jgi:hypothetical protein
LISSAARSISVRIAPAIFRFNHIGAPLSTRKKMPARDDCGGGLRHVVVVKPCEVMVGAARLQDMRYFQRDSSESSGDFDIATMLIRVTITLVAGGLLVLGWRLWAHDRPRFQLPLRRRPLLSIEDAVRWRPEF